VHEGHPAIGLLLRDAGSGLVALCTATLVAPSTVLTAAHCVDGATSVNALRFLSGADLSQNNLGTNHTVTQFIVHPGYSAPPGQPPASDIALVTLQHGPAVEPIPIARNAPATGEPATVIGYGITDDGAGGAGTKRIATNVIDQVTNERIRLAGTGNGTGNICDGDSGGPSLATRNGREILIGVHSFVSGTDPNNLCGVFGNDLRVDVYAPWIESNVPNVALEALTTAADAGPGLLADAGIAVDVHPQAPPDITASAVETSVAPGADLASPPRDAALRLDASPGDRGDKGDSTAPAPSGQSDARANDSGVGQPTPDTSPSAAGLLHAEPGTGCSVASGRSSELSVVGLLLLLACSRRGRSRYRR
jgi:secreted trypsin-like serine protease